jgi:hypothetical protein
MVEPDITTELNSVRHMSKRSRDAISRELSSHLREAQRELTLLGRSPEEAVAEGRRRLGDPREIAVAFSDVYRRSRRRRIGLAVGLAGALLAGAYSAGSTLASTTSSHHTPIMARAKR